MILTSDKRHVQIFDDRFKIDNELPKWQRVIAIREIIEKKILDSKLRDKNGEDFTEAVNKLFETGELEVKGSDNDTELSVEGLPDMTMSLNDYEYVLKYHDGKIPTYSDILRIVEDSEKKDTLTEFNVSLTSVINNMLKKSWYSKINDGEIMAAEKDNSEKLSPLQKFLKKNEQRKEKKRQDSFDVAGFFNQIKLSSKDESDKYVMRLNEYINAFAYAERMGQDALKEKLFEEIIINKYESLLYAKNMLKTVSEETIIKFALGCPKGLSLCYIANYTGFIPKDVMKKKIDIDELEIFDNYCIMFYDSDVKSYQQLTQEEKEREAKRRNDPILFGMINGSKKLYFIADWIDDKCDLTFDKIIDLVGKDVVEKDYIKSKINLPKL